MTFRLREIRKRAGMTQARLGALCGLDAAQINHYECERRLPNWANAVNIAVALGCTLDELAGIEARSEG